VNKTTEALKLAEEALLNTGNALMVISAGRNLRQLYGEMRDDAVERCNKALAAIREALAEQEKQEPVAWLNPHNQAVIDVRKKKQIGEGKGYPNFSTPLYAAPVSAKREWVDLSNDEIDELIRKWHSPDMGLLDFAWAVIAAFKEKNK